jgi:hypothetical protein
MSRTFEDDDSSSTHKTSMHSLQEEEGREEAKEQEIWKIKQFQFSGNAS